VLDGFPEQGSGEVGQDAADVSSQMNGLVLTRVDTTVNG